MDSMLGSDSSASFNDPGDTHGQRAPNPHPRDPLEWEIPGVDAPSGEQIGSPNDGAAEDVLVETPDFLRDTPEQERLWFEQRPPRDFDFKE
jgi:hypothetical protein